MSEYQYYEFLAVDRPLDARQQAKVRALSTRARVTATTFTNEYHWGNFSGDPRRMMERYYDAHLYLTNWGSPGEVFDHVITSLYADRSMHAAASSQWPHEFVTRLPPSAAPRRRPWATSGRR
ncbi:hypothetical protein AB0M44_15755 [Streptosporangium subroseum]|uniref:hypothetical protein n=1 Tax=Streptosporangium subroseum TaxID=106412 RepID=UPI003420F2F3